MVHYIRKTGNYFQLKIEFGHLGYVVALQYCIWQLICAEKIYGQPKVVDRTSEKMIAVE